MPFFPDSRPCLVNGKYCTCVYCKHWLLLTNVFMDYDICKMSCNQLQIERKGRGGMEREGEREKEREGEREIRQNKEKKERKKRREDTEKTERERNRREIEKREREERVRGKIVRCDGIISCLQSVLWSSVMHAISHLWRGLLKLNFMQYPTIHTHYSWSNCTISNLKYLNRSSEFLGIN